MKYSFTALALAGLASAASVDTKELASTVSVSLSSVDHTTVKATITNNGAKGYNIMHKGTILDTLPVNKFHVSKDATEAEFQGVSLRMSTKNFQEEDFTALAAGETKEVTVNLAEIYGLDASGKYDVNAVGNFRFAELGSTELVQGGSLRFESNQVSLEVDATRSRQTVKAVHASLAGRSTISSDCSASQKSTIADGERRCAAQANAAADAALNGSASKFQEYFKSTATADRQLVANRLKAVAKECTSTPGGILDVHCDDIYNYCQGNTFAYTVSADDAVVWCNQYWASDLETNQCHGDDKTGTTIHEYTHASHVFSPGTRDNAYGYPDCMRLSRTQALNNADTYEYYANGKLSPTSDLQCFPANLFITAIHLGC